MPRTLELRKDKIVLTSDEGKRQLPSTYSGRKYRTILIDPPWNINQKNGGKRKGRGAEAHYPLMELEDILSMPINEIADEDAHLYCWITNAMVPYIAFILTAWGFEFSSLIAWEKQDRLPLGNDFRLCYEYQLFAKKGKPKVKCHNQRNKIVGPVQDHSHKPEEQFPIIERMSDGPYIEIFARRSPFSNSDWSIWGNEVDSDIVIPGYPVPRYSDKAA